MRTHTKAARNAGIISGCLIAGTAMAGDVGYISTDRFGYEGTIVRYDTLADAQSGTNATDNISVTDRDLSVYASSGSATTGFNGGTDANVFMGSWWYSTAVDGGGNPQGAGWGNTNGNTGVGYMQMYDIGGLTDTSVDMGFNGFNGTHYTDFMLSISGENADADQYSRLSAYNNVNDGGIWHNYQMDMLVTGLEGVDDGTGFAVANNQPVGVTGTFTGLFQLTENQTNPDSQGFYVVTFNLNMDNWAWDNRDDLVGDTFADSVFGAQIVPLPPAAFAALGMLAGFAGVRHLRRRS
ncbi:MAG: hypothetical protein WD114_01405 [Phycisphaerales bacterium]